MRGATNPKTFLITSVFLFAMACGIAAGGTIYVDDDGPQQSTTGLVPPPGVEPKVRGEAVVLEEGMEMILVPGYSWRHGCGPTAVGMVVGYYDGQGYDDLIPGDAFSQTAAVYPASSEYIHKLSNRRELYVK